MKYRNETALKADIARWVIEASLELAIKTAVYGRAEKFRSGVPDQEIMIEYAPSVFIESKVRHKYSPDQVGWAKTTHRITKHMTYGVQAYANTLFKIRPLLNADEEYTSTDLKSEIKKWLIEAILSTERRTTNAKICLQ